MPDSIAYATAKGALIGFMRSLSLAGTPHGITVNAIAPNAVTSPGTSRAANSMTTSPLATPVDDLRTELVSPIVGYLAHETCTVTGQIYMAGARRFAKMLIAATDGYLHDEHTTPTIDDVAAHWDAINDERTHYTPATAVAWAQRYLAHTRAQSTHS